MATLFEVRCERRTETGTNGNEETADPRSETMSDVRNPNPNLPPPAGGAAGGDAPRRAYETKQHFNFLYTLYTAELVAVAGSGYWVI